MQANIESSVLQEHVEYVMCQRELAEVQRKLARTVLKIAQQELIETESIFLLYTQGGGSRLLRIAEKLERCRMAAEQAKKAYYEAEKEELFWAKCIATR